MIQSTIIQNGALYLVQHKTSRLRRALFRRLRKAIARQDPEFRSITFTQLFRRESASRSWPRMRLFHLSAS